MNQADAASVTPFARLLLVVSGSLSAALVPYWANWLRTERAGVSTRIVLTRSALRFVTPTALAAATGSGVEMDTWEGGHSDHVAVACHADFADWAEAVLVYPATWHYVARLAQGLADTPSLLALHISTAPVLVAPSLPPGSLESPILRDHLDRLRARERYAVAPMLVAMSATSGRPGALIPPPLPDLVAALEEQAGQETSASSTPDRSAVL